MHKYIIFPESDKSFPLSTDSVLLSVFANVHEKDLVCDLCSGPGTLSLLLCARHPELRCVGFELQRESVEKSMEFIAINHMEERVSIQQCDIRQFDTLAPKGTFDTIVSNPPYFPIGSGHIPDDDHSAVARTELCCTLKDLITAAAYLVKYGGDFFFVHKPERLADISCVLRENGFELKTLRFVKNRPGTVPSLILVHAKRNGKPGVRYLPDFCIQETTGEYSQEYLKIYGIGEN